MTQRPTPDDRSEARATDAAKLLETAVQQPGVAELFRLYEKHAETVRQADAYLKPRAIIFATSDATA